MQTRLNAYGTDLGPKFVKHIGSANRAIIGSPLPAATRELVNIRAS